MSVDTAKMRELANQHETLASLGHQVMLPGAILHYAARDILRSAADELDELRSMNAGLHQTLREADDRNEELRERLQSAEAALRDSHGDSGPNRCPACDYFSRYAQSEGGER